MPELSTLRTTWQSQPEAQDAIWEQTMITQLDFMRPERAQTPLDFG